MNHSSVVFFDLSFHPIQTPENAAFWQVDSIWGISNAPLNALSSILKKHPTKKGFILLDFYAPDLEWELIRKTDIALSELNLPYNVYHVSLGDLEPMIKTRKWQPSVTEYETYKRLSFELNAEVLMLFAKEIDSLAQSLLCKVLFDAADEYTLEGHLSSFHQEVISVLLSERLHNLHALTKEISKKDPADQSVLQLEKDILRTRRGIALNVQNLIPLINQMLETLKIVQQDRHEWADIEMALQYLNVLCTKKGNQEKALYQLAKYLSFDLIILGDWNHQSVQSFLKQAEDLFGVR